MRTFVPKTPKKDKSKFFENSKNRSRMISTLKKHGFTDAYLNAKTNKELGKMMNRFVPSKHTPNTNTFGKLQTPRGWLHM